MTVKFTGLLKLVHKIFLPKPYVWGLFTCLSVIMSSRKLNNEVQPASSRKAVRSRPRQPVLCVAPSSTDKLVLLRACDYVVSATRDCLSEVWTPGIQAERAEEAAGGTETLREFKLRGHPWHGEGEESTLCRRLLLELVGRLGGLRWRLMAATNLKGGTDALFFIYDEDHLLEGPGELSMLSLCRHDRVRMINMGSEALAAVRLAILNFYQTKEPEERNYYGAFEFKVNIIK